MKLLLINPNTSPDITARVVAEARRLVGPGTTVAGSTGRFGARYITSRAAVAVAGHAALDAYAQDSEGADAVVLACFGDPGLFALRELAPVPVVGMAEAACHLAATLGRRFAIVTGGERWGPMLEEFVAAIGLRSRLSQIRTVAPSGAEIAADPEAALAGLTAEAVAAAASGAEAVILGGAGLVGLAARIAPSVPVPLVDALAAALAAAESAARLGLRKPTAGSHAAPPAVATEGLHPRLAQLFAGGPAAP